MALENLTKDPSRPKKGPDCSVCAALKEMSEKQAKILTAALSDKNRRYSEIEREVSTEPTFPDWIRNISEGTYRKHAVGKCWARTKLR